MAWKSQDGVLGKVHGVIARIRFPYGWKLIKHQWWWSDWWKLWPVYADLEWWYYYPVEHPGNFQCVDRFICLGPLQTRWRKELTMC